MLTLLGSVAPLGGVAAVGGQYERNVLLARVESAPQRRVALAVQHEHVRAALAQVLDDERQVTLDGELQGGQLVLGHLHVYVHIGLIEQEERRLGALTQDGLVEQRHALVVLYVHVGALS